MATLQQLVEAKVGSVSETELLKQALQQALHNLFSVLPAEQALSYAKQSTGQSSSGIPFRGRLVGAEIGGRRSRRVEPSMSGLAQDTHSIHQATPLFPVVWTHQGQAYGHPDGAMKIYSAEAPSVEPTDENIAGSPHGSEELATLYASSVIAASRAASLDLPDPLSLPSSPTPPAAPSFSYSDVAAETIDPVTIGQLPPPPEYDGIDPSELPSLPDAMTVGSVGDSDDQVDMNTWFSVLGQLIENEEDPELATQAVARIQSWIQAVRAKTEDAAGALQAALADYQGGVQKMIEQANIDGRRALEQARMTTDANLANELQNLQAALAEYQSQLERFNGEVGAYSSGVQAENAEWQSEMASFQGSQNKWIQAAMDYYQRYVFKLQNIAFNEHAADDRAGDRAEPGR